MDFNDIKKNSLYEKASFNNPWMGLNGGVCTSPVYWCRLHEVWLSEEDVSQKSCSARLTYDMITRKRCNCLERKEVNPFLKGD